MSTERQRDAETDRLLRATLQPGVDAEACPGADMLAAYAEGSLSASERDNLDVHFSDCHRCQEALAFIARAWPEPAVAQAMASKRWWSLPMRWLVPVSVAAMVVMYVAVRPVIAPYFPSSVPPSGADQSPAPEHVMADIRLPEGGSIKTEPDASREWRGTPPRESGAASADRATREVASVSGRRATAGNEARLDAPPPAGLAAAPAALPAPVPAAARAEAAGASRQQLAMKVSAPVLRDIASPDGSATWRIEPGNRVFRSTDHGTTWQAQSTGVLADLLAGSAASATVCWIVGRNASVIVTTDGARWTPRPFPERVDLVAVEATDGRSAIVTARDGRRFVTLDGGITWSAGRN
ncbi:MAG: zf-HC2 domain-containing protein [Acidobacteria bacterium]|nr:zf-HC2 domain-containing protein [Acidobacteriota bacterium]